MSNKFLIDIENVEFRQKGSIKPGYGKSPLKFKFNDEKIIKYQKKRRKKAPDILDNNDLTYEKQENYCYYNDYISNDDTYMIKPLNCLKFKYRPKIKKEIPPKNRYEQYKPDWKPRYMYV
ncbi:uncharacterized protein METZ01_LOCUS280020 [marine metagenome]|uniref:Uncharacterized protein n=1 Tax=marine metagenome TaxID=408172 RepID=A0A382KS69_9ZZZZ